jgi:hypothetical protein
MIGKIIYLMPDDDPPGVSDRIEWANADRVVLVFPAQPAHPWREVDFAHIYHAAQRMGCQVAVVSPRAAERQMAHDTGLLSFHSTRQAVTQHWLPNDDVDPVERQVPPRRFHPNSLRRLFPSRNYLRIGLRVMGAILTLAVLAAAVLTIVPTANVTLTASQQNISLIVPVTLDTQSDKVDVQTRTVPATRVDVVVEDVASVPTTGAKDIPSGKAKGTIVLYNVLTSAYTVPKNSVVRTTSASLAVRFVTLNDVEVPPGGQAQVAIEALDEGPSGNVPANQINLVEGVAGLAVKAVNPSPTTGGGMVTKHAVTLEDYSRVRAVLMDKLMQVALEKMNQDTEVTRNGLYIVPNTFFIADVQDETYDRFVTEQADEVKLDMRIQVAGYAVSPADLKSVAQSSLVDKVSTGYSLLDTSIERGDVAEEGTGNRIELYMVAHGVAGAKIDENQVKRLVRGKPISEAQSALLQEFSLKGNPVISVEPQWLFGFTNRLPYITLRIQTQVKRE